MKHYNRFDGIKGYPLESIVKQGSGMVNISKSILSKLGISPGKISLGSVFSTTNISKTVNIYLINFSNETLSVVPSSVFALSVNSDDVNSPVFYKQREPGILVSFLPNMVNISPLGTQMIVVKFDFVTPLKSTKHLLILNGFLNFNFLSENITVPYAALIGVNYKSMISLTKVAN